MPEFGLGDGDVEGQGVVLLSLLVPLVTEVLGKVLFRTLLPFLENPQRRLSLRERRQRGKG